MVEIKHGKDKRNIPKWFKDAGYVNIWDGEYNFLFIPKMKFHIVVVCTPNYIEIGGLGVEALQKYSRIHGYEFTIVKKAIEGLHVNFTKNEAGIQVIDAGCKSDFIVTIDADIAILDFNVRLERLFLTTGLDREHIPMRAPKDRFISPNPKKTKFADKCGLHHMG